MAVHIHTTPSGVNAFGLSGFSLVHGAVPVPPPLLTAETVAMLEAVGHQEIATRHARSCRRPLAHHTRRCRSVQTRIRS